jgi:hypothetical protein
MVILYDKFYDDIVTALTQIANHGVYLSIEKPIYRIAEFMVVATVLWKKTNKREHVFFDILAQIRLDTFAFILYEKLNVLCCNYLRYGRDLSEAVKIWRKMDMVIREMYDVNK